MRAGGIQIGGAASFGSFKVLMGKLSTSFVIVLVNIIINIIESSGSPGCGATTFFALQAEKIKSSHFCHMVRKSQIFFFLV